MIKKKALFATQVVIALGLSACSVGKNYAGPPAVAPNAMQRGTFLNADSAAAHGVALPSRWWTELHDDVLTELIERALHNAPTIQMASSRLTQARLEAQISEAASRPSVEAGGGAIATTNGLITLPEPLGSQPLHAFSSGLMASWEIDLFGANARRTEAAAARASGALASLADTEVVLSASVALEYAELRAKQARLAVLQTRLARLEHLKYLAQQRDQYGETGQLALAAANEEVAAARSEIVGAKAGIDTSLNTLALLIGQEPGALEALRTTAVMPLPPAGISIPDPAAIIRNRPDIRVAESNLAAANAEVGESMANRFPRVSLLGLIGVGSSGGSSVLSASGLNALALPRLTVPLFDGGQRKNMVKIADAKRIEAEGRYQETVLSSLTDCENALINFGSSRAQLAHALEGLQASQQRVVAEEQRHKMGQSGDESLERALLQSDDTQITIIAKKLSLTQSYIRIVRALGIGWQAAAP